MISLFFKRCIAGDTGFRIMTIAVGHTPEEVPIAASKRLNIEKW